MILDMWSIYTKYFDQTTKANKKYDRIYTCTSKLKQKLYISNKEKKQIVYFLQQQTVKIKCYKKMIDIL